MSGVKGDIQHDPALLTALQEAMNALQYGHHVICGSQTGNIFDRTIPLVRDEILKAERIQPFKERP
jgi:hypothetical protein